jgi:hypothetical protein
MGANLTENTGRGQGADEDEVVAVSGATAAVNRGGRRWGFCHRGVGLQREEKTKKKTSSLRNKKMNRYPGPALLAGPLAGRLRPMAGSPLFFLFPFPFFIFWLEFLI